MAESAPNLTSLEKLREAKIVSTRLGEMKAKENAAAAAPSAVTAKANSKLVAANSTLVAPALGTAVKSGAKNYTIRMTPKNGKNGNFNAAIRSVVNATGGRRKHRKHRTHKYHTHMLRKRSHRRAR